MQPTTNTMQKPGLEATADVKNDHSSARRSRAAVIGIGIIAVLLVISTVFAVITFIQVKKVKDQWEALGDEEKTTLERMKVKDQWEALTDEEKTTMERMTAEDSKLADKDSVEANITYHLPLLNKTIEEKVVVTNDEEDITTPELRTIFDFNRGYIVTHLLIDGNGTDVDICFVRKFTPRGSTNMIKATVKAEKRNVVVMSEVATELYISTGEPFDRNLLSERASAMCRDSQLVFTRKSNETVPGNTEGNSAVRKKRMMCRPFSVCTTECSPLITENVIKTCTGTWWGRTCNYIKHITVKQICKSVCNTGCI